MKKQFITLLIIACAQLVFAQTNPVISSWIQNTTGIKGQHYENNNSPVIQDNDSANVKPVLYSSSWVYVRANGIPAYPTGPFFGNPSLAISQNAIFKMPLNPEQNIGNLTVTTGGNIGLFINEVAWDSASNALCGGPGNPPCPGGMGAVQFWSRDAIPAEKPGFDCSKGHPAIGNYHHHQNPSAFDLDLNVISTICNLYAADGLYAIDSTQHSPLIGFAYDGFPIYGAYANLNTNGTGGITSMKSNDKVREIWF